MGYKDRIRDYLLTAEVGDITPYRGKLDPEFKAKWVAALRQGDRQQGVCVLKYKSSVDEGVFYCCLGVACEVASIPAAEKDNGAIDFDGSTYALSTGVQDRLGLSDTGGFRTTVLNSDIHGPDPRGEVYGSSRFSSSLAAMNDEYGFTFPMIADFIEKHF
jgi:hypothetical protein